MPYDDVIRDFIMRQRTMAPQRLGSHRATEQPMNNAALDDRVGPGSPLQNSYMSGIMPQWQRMMEAAKSQAPSPPSPDMVQANADIDQASRIGQAMQKNRLSDQFDRSQALRTQARIGQDDAHRARMALLTGPYSKAADTTAMYDKFGITEDFLMGRAQQIGGNTPARGNSSVRGPIQLVPSGQGQTLHQRFGGGVIPRSVSPGFNEGGGIPTLTPEQTAERRAQQQDFFLNRRISGRGVSQENFSQFQQRMQREDEAKTRVIYDNAGKPVAVTGNAKPLDAGMSQANQLKNNLDRARIEKMRLETDALRNSLSPVERAKLDSSLRIITSGEFLADDPIMIAANAYIDTLEKRYQTSQGDVTDPPAGVQPMPPRGTPLQPGTIYMTPRGPARWDGQAFETI